MKYEKKSYPRFEFCMEKVRQIKKSKIKKEKQLIIIK